MSAAFAVRGPPLLLWAGQPGWQRLWYSSLLVLHRALSRLARAKEAC